MPSAYKPVPSLLVATALTVGLAHEAAAQDGDVPDADPIAVAADDMLAAIAPRAVQAVYTPLHAAFARDAARLDDAVNAWCDAAGASNASNASDAARADARLDAARATWRPAVASFAAVEPLKVGPLLEDNRINRVFFWPDSRRAGERQMRALLAESGPLDEAGVAGKSVAVQGLPALERLLHGKAAASDPITVCRVARPVAGNVRTIAEELAAAWDPERGAFGMRLTSPSAADALFRSDNEVLRSLLTQLQAGLEALAGPKLVPVAEGDAGDMRALPFARSALYPEYLRGNLDGLAALLLDGGLADAADVAGEAKFEVGNARRLIDKLAGELAGNGTLRAPPSEDAMGTAGALRAGILALERLVLDRVAPALGTRTGFNSADGD